MNSITMLGRLTRDPEMKYVGAKQTACVECAIAVETRLGGDNKDEVCYLDFTIFGKSAEAMNTRFRKGDPILITGRVRHETWVDRTDGKKRHKHKILVSNWYFAGNTGGNTNQQQGRQEQPPRQQQGTQQRTARDYGFESGSNESYDDVPF